MAVDYGPGQPGPSGSSSGGPRSLPGVTTRAATLDGGRVVVLLCGAPGSGKSTLARELAAERRLSIYDLDDPQWQGSETAFRRAIRSLALDQHARAVVIRSGARARSRDHWAAMSGATHAIVLDTPATLCRLRIIERDRRYPHTITQQLAALSQWYRNYQPPPPEWIHP